MVRRRFELLSKDKAPKFWELLHDPDAAFVSTRTGKIGAVGSVRTWRLAGGARAERKAQRLVASRVDEGYVEVAGDAAQA